MSLLRPFRPVRLAAASALALGLALPALAATSSLDAYNRQGPAPTQQVVHYVKSNLDGSKRSVLSLYFPAPLEVEVLKAEADGRYLALVRARLDPQTLSEAWMRSYNHLERGPGQERLQMQMDAEPGAARRIAQVAGTQMPVTASHLPAHVYNFDLSGLNLTLPLLKNPRADFQVGLVDPDFAFLRQHFKPNAGTLDGGFKDKGLARFRYVGDETLDDEVAVHRYEVSGPAFGGQTGWLWVNAQDRLIERFEHPVPDNPDWSSFKLQRLSSRPLDAAGWATFKEATVRRAMGLREAE
ncbi:hypothetical protein [Inhella gelatinilytica]|uniref:Uncharacterized protein n=1 Tax=Inhella gelatinilytica TaxID=2795030 RepID=A0A931IX11_9BURK|nr:hypothetical protein [Inhella gelatinilytica]MBH9551431.1 hypothetical protein [Inhella gelatinilytica]